MDLLKAISRPGMTNFDHSIDPDMDQWLRDHPGEECQHSAWNFCGSVSYNEETQLFEERVMVHGVQQATKTCDTLKGLMQQVNDIYGWA